MVVSSMPNHERDSSPSVEVIEYLDALWLQRGLSENTLAAYRRDLTQTENWLLQTKRAATLINASAEDLGAYNEMRNGENIARRSAARWGVRPASRRRPSRARRRLAACRRRRPCVLAERRRRRRERSKGRTRMERQSVTTDHPIDRLAD